MNKEIKVGISKNNNQEIKSVSSIDLIAGKGVIGDRHFHEYNTERNQITLIESENIDYYNKKFNLQIPYLNFRRNIVTHGIKLNDLIEKKIIIGKIDIEGTDLCRPCKHLQEKLGQNNIIEEFIRRGGLRCKILTSGKIQIDDKITIT